MTTTVDERINVRTTSPLAGRMVKALLAGTGRNQDSIAVTLEPEMTPAGVRIELEGSESWMFLSLDSSSAAVIAALEAGAGGVLTLDSTAEDVEHGLASMRSNGVGYLPVEVLRQLARGHSALGSEPNWRERNAEIPILTEREVEVLRGVAKGDSNSDIASRLGISYHTVRSHVRTLAIKLGTTTRTEMLSRAPGILNGYSASPDTSGSAKH